MSNPSQPVVWVLVADGDSARVVTPSAREGQFHTVESFQHAGTGAHHGAASRLDPHAQAKQRYAASIAEALDRQVAAYTQLVLVAPPHTLHDLREALGKQATAKVVDSLNKDLVKLNDHDVSGHLAKWWLVPA
ncbi:MAG: host attachment protein [Alphaproteobacteria bacterium]|nr:host attachment protein [Alphaproteobacteria bacterium]